MRYLLILCCFCFFNAGAQSSIDSSSRNVVSQVLKKDTIIPVLKQSFTSDSFLYGDRLFFSFTNPVRYTVSEKTYESKDVIFYLVTGLLLLFALIKNSFRRYLTDLVSTYFRTTMYPRQLKDQLLQNPLPSFLFNIFFVLSGCVYIALVFQYYHTVASYSFWQLASYAALGLTGIYLGKFLILKFLGWLFQAKEATDTYLFVVFANNKITGFILLPFTLLLAFAGSAVQSAMLTLSFVTVGGLFLYRYFISFISINRLVQISLFQFLIYLVAVEIIPLLLINKVLFLILAEIS